jgi:hypothetical protein
MMEFSAGQDLRVPALLALLKEVIESDAAKTPEGRDAAIAHWKSRAIELTDNVLRLKPGPIAALLDPTIDEQVQVLQAELSQKLTREVESWFEGAFDQAKQESGDGNDR